jgi:hypothetical protein
MKLFILFVVLFCLFFYIGCGSKVPIADVSQAISDDRIVGKWTSLEKPQDEYLEIEVFKFNEKEYLAITQQERKVSEKITVEKDYLRVYLLNISDKYFMNAQDIESDDPTDRLFYFLNYKFLSDSLIILCELKDIDTIRVDDFEKSEDLYNFIKANVDNVKLYGEEIKFIKLK